MAVRIGAAVAPIQDRGAGQHDTIKVRMGGVDTGVEDGHRRGTADGDGTEQVGPADLRKRPLVGEGGVGGLRFDLAGAVEVNARHIGLRTQRGQLVGVGGIGQEDGAHRQLRDGMTSVAPASARISSWRAFEVPVAKVMT